MFTGATVEILIVIFLLSICLTSLLDVMEQDILEKDGAPKFWDHFHCYRNIAALEPPDQNVCRFNT